MNKTFLKTLAVAALCSAAVSAQTLHSPDGQLTLQFSLDADGRPTYSLACKGRTAIAPSHLGIELKGEAQRRDFSDSGNDKAGSALSLTSGFVVADTRKIRARMGNKMNEGMVASYKKVIEKVVPENPDRIRK